LLSFFSALFFFGLVISAFLRGPKRWDVYLIASSFGLLYSMKKVYFQSLLKLRLNFIKFFLPYFSRSLQGNNIWHKFIVNFGVTYCDAFLTDFFSNAFSNQNLPLLTTKDVNF
jgi:hypothetical protein